MFYRSATIIVSFIHQLTNSCDVNNHRNWSQLSYDQFSDELLELSSVSGDEDHDHDHEDHDDEHGEHSDDNDDDHHDHHHDEHEEHEEKYFATGQLEYLLRQVADSYQPGKSAVLDGLPREQLDFDCSFGNLKVWLLLF